MLWAKQTAAIKSTLDAIIFWLNQAKAPSYGVRYWRDTIVETLSQSDVVEKYIGSAQWSAPQKTPLSPLDGMLRRLLQFDAEMSAALAQRRAMLCYISRLADVAPLEAIDVYAI